MSVYRCIFFDLDHTLWDYEKNCAETLVDLHDRYQLAEKGINSFAEFLSTFHIINNEMWDLYDRGLLHRDALRKDRFHRILKSFDIDDLEMSLQFSHDYISESPLRKNLVTDALEILDYLTPTYPLFIITNGFDEIQSKKLTSSGIEKYFRQIITSEKAGHKKPSREIFDYALTQHGFLAKETIMIGDNLLTDIAGARNAGIDHVFFNPHNVTHKETVTHEIRGLKELKNIL